MWVRARCCRHVHFPLLKLYLSLDQLWLKRHGLYSFTTQWLLKGLCHEMATCCCGVMGVQVSKCVRPRGRLAGSHFSLAVSAQLEHELGNGVKTHDLVTKEIQEMARRVVAVLGSELASMLVCWFELFAPVMW